jgi:hypothetical protein
MNKVVAMRLAVAMAGGIGLGGLIMMAPLAAGSSAETPAVKAPAPVEQPLRVHGKKIALTYALR